MIPSLDSTAGTQALRPGRNGLGTDYIARFQRARIVAAMVEVVAERGLARSSVAHVVAKSGVSRRTFYEVFADRDDCFLAALDDAIARAGELVLPAYEAGGGLWRDRIRGGLACLLSFLDHESATGRLLFVEALGAGQAAHERRRRVLDRLIPAVEEGRGEAGARGDLPELTGEGVAGAVLSVIQARMIEDGSRPLAGLTGALMGIVVLPYLGPAAARREMARAAPESFPRAQPPSEVSLGDLPMRITYRTAMVLMAIGAQPGASNRAVGRAAGVEDPGQISKLLARLRRIDLIETTADGRFANAWSLTPRGKRVEQSLRLRAR